MKSVTARKICLMLATSGLAMIANVTPAFAQGLPSEDSTSLDEIVVQARKITENVQDVPVAVTVLSGQDLVERGVQRVQDIAQSTPGLMIRQGQNTPAALTISLRGQVQTDTLVTLDPSVGTYVDGVYWARSYGLNSDFLDVESVQVLKGPQGTLFGRNTTGGAILINSNNPNLEDFSGKIGLTYGRFNEFQATGVANVPIVPGKIALRVAGQRFTRDGYTTNVVGAAAKSVANSTTPMFKPPFIGNPNGVKLDNRDRINLRGKLDLKPMDDLTLRFSAEYFNMDERGPSRQILLATNSFVAGAGQNSTYNVGNLTALFTGLVNGAAPANFVSTGLSLLNAGIARTNADPRVAENNEVAFAYAKTQTYGFTGILDTDFGQIQLITGMRKIDSHAAFDIDGSQYQAHLTSSDQSVKQYSGELQMTGKAFADKLDYAAGFFLFHEKGFDDSISIVAPAVNPVTSHQIGLIDNDSSGAYSQFTYHFTDALSFTGGLRYSVDSKSVDSRNNNYNRGTTTSTGGIPGLTHQCALIPTVFIPGAETINQPLCSVKRSDSFRGWSYTAGLEYKPTEDLMVYVKTAKGFRSGGQQLRAPSLPFLLPFQPETAYSYEIGLKSEFFDRRVRFNVAAYQTDIKNIQRTTLIAQPGAATGASATILGNAGKSRFRGFEADLAFAATENLRISGFVAHIDPKYVSYSDLSGDRSFERFDSVIPWQWGGAADFTQDLGDAKGKLHVDYSWTDDMPTGPYFYAPNPQNAAIIAATTRPSMGLLGARASVSFDEDRYEVAIFGRNITNNRGYLSNLLVAPVGYVSGVRMEPATYGVSASVKF